MKPTCPIKPAYPVYPTPLKNKASSIFMFFKKRHSWLDGIYERSYRMKMGRVKLPGLEIFMVNQPDLVKRIMIDDVESFPKNHMLGEILKPLLGESIFTTNGEQWRKQRNMLDVAFDNAQVERVFGRMQEAVERMLGRFARYPVGSVVDVDPEMTLITADIIFRTIMSSSLDTQEAVTIMEAFSRFQAASPKLALLKIFKIPDNWLLRLSDRNRIRDASVIRTSLADVIRPRYDAYLQTQQDSNNDILATILQAKDPKSDQPFSFEEILDQVSMLFLAGHETSASALTWSLYLLALSPDIQQAAVAEIQAAMAETASDDGQALSLAAVKRLGLIRRIFMEALRLYPPVGFLTRQASDETDMLDKHLPAQSTVVVSPWLLHRHRDLWEEPDAFCPVRFDPKAGGRTVPKHAYLPFGLGPRVCIGATFAMQEAILILAELLKKYSFELAPNFQPEPVGRLTIRSDNGMRLILKQRL